MKPANAQNEFQEYLGRNGLNKTLLTPATGISAMLAFYREVRADGCQFERDGDMLLFQWGTFDWDKGEWFELNITRQLIFTVADADEDVYEEGDGDEDIAEGEDEEENDEMWQLSLTFKFKAASTLRLLSAESDEQNSWCQNLDELSAFERYIHTNAVFQSLADSPPAVVELDYYCTD